MAVTKEKSKKKFRRLPDHRPDMILDAAEVIFGQHGFDATRVDGIAREAGITKGTIYLYFKSKKEIFLKMVERRGLGIVALLNQFEATEKGISFDELLGKTLPFLRAFLKDPAYPTFLRLLISESGRFPEMGKEFFRNIPQQAMKPGIEAYKRSQKDRKVKELDSRIVMRCLFGMHIVFVVTQELFGAKEFDPIRWEEIERTIDKIFWDGIRRRE